MTGLTSKLHAFMDVGAVGLYYEKVDTEMISERTQFRYPSTGPAKT